MGNLSSPLACDRCPNRFADGRQPGDRCNDLSWVPPTLRAAAFYTGRAWGHRFRQSLRCHGRVYPPDDPHLRKHWSPERLQAHRDKLTRRLIVKLRLKERKETPAHVG